MEFIIFQHTVIVPKYFQTSANKPKFIHSKYITNNNGELIFFIYKYNNFIL